MSLLGPRKQETQNREANSPQMFVSHWLPRLTRHLLSFGPHLASDALVARIYFSTRNIAYRHVATFGNTLAFLAVEIIQILRNLLKCCSFRLGLGILGVGTVVSFVGLGEKGFRSSELRLLGPILSGFGLALCIIRICLCCSGCDPRRRAPPSKLAAKLKKMEGGREPIQMVRIAEAVAFIPAIHQSAEIRSTPHAPTQIQHHTPVEVDPGC